MSTAFPVASPATGSDTATQTELPREHADIQVSGCRLCPSFMSVFDGNIEYTCGMCAPGRSNAQPCGRTVGKGGHDEDHQGV